MIGWRAQWNSKQGTTNVQEGQPETPQTGVSPDPRKLKVLMGTPLPKCKKELQ